MLQDVSSSVTRSVSERLATVSAACLAVFAPLVLLAFNRDWLVTPAGWLDPWHYVGFFHAYWNPEFGAGAYKIGRLPWILSGALAWSVLPPLSAAYVLHLFYLCATTLATFVGVRRLFGHRTLAAVVALCLGFYPPAHGSGGWDYHNTPAGAFYLATFATLASPAAIAARRGALLLAGALVALTVHSNITLVNFLPALGFVHVYHARLSGTSVSPRALAARAAWILAGAVAITAALALVNWRAGRGALFFAALLEKVVNYVGDTRNQAPFRSSGGWYYTAAYLSLPVAVFAIGAVAIVRTRNARDREARLARALIAQFLCMALVWTGWQLAGQTALDWDYFAYALVPSCFIGMAGLLRLAWHVEYERRPVIVAFGGAAVLAFMLSGAAESAVVPVAARFAGIIMPTAAIMFGVAFAALFVRPAAVALSVFVFAFALANRVAAPGADSRYALTDPCKTQPRIYEAVVDAGIWLGSLDPTYSRIHTWFDHGEQLAPGPAECHVAVADIGQSATAMVLSEPLVASDATNDISSAALETVSDGESVLALITGSSAAGERWAARLREQGLTYREIASHRVAVGETDFMIHAWVVEQPAPDGLTFGAPLLTVAPGSDTRGSGGTSSLVKPHAQLTYPAVTVTSAGTDTWARLTIETSAALAPCRVLLQDQRGGTLASALCASGTRYVPIPASTPAIGVTVENTSAHPAQLPTRIEVSLASK